MVEKKIDISCSLCTEHTEQTINLPEGWDLAWDAIDEENALCPSHSAIRPFINSQCPGCVGGWGDCNLFRDFAYREMNLTDGDFSLLRSGICPRRTNGTLMVNRTAEGADFKHLDLSEAAPPEAGEALADAILEYSRTYHD